MSQLWSVAPARNGGQWRIGYRQGSGFPQVAALHLRDGYLRLAPGTGWGTSVILPPSFWKRGRLYQGARVTGQSEPHGDNLELALTATRGGLTTRLHVVITPPTEGIIKARVAAETEGDVSLDAREGEGFKPVTLSSMKVSSTLWDAEAALLGERKIPIRADGSEWFIAPDQVLRQHLGLRGGSSGWKTDAPTVTVKLGQPLVIAGWRTRSANPNDDNLALWAAASQVLPSWRYEVTARTEEMEK